jgi:3-methyl-2-oxobutanoate hydroxymethyltransferase
MPEPAAWPADRRITITDLQAATDRGERWSMLTSYDTLTAGVFEQAGVRALLVGDTSAEIVLGLQTTVPMTMDQLIPMVQAVVRGTQTALVVADLPFGSYEAGPEVALRNAVRHLKEGGAQAVKLEGGHRVLPQVRAMTAAGIPVMGHLGLTPQSVNTDGRHRRRSVLRRADPGLAGYGRVDHRAAAPLREAVRQPA